MNHVFFIFAPLHLCVFAFSLDGESRVELIPVAADRIPCFIAFLKL
jgi:hypothetical protein